MKIPELKSFVKKICTENKHLPIMIWGPPGVGKSQAIQQVAEELKLDFIDLRLSLLNPIDLRGLPFINKETHRAEWLTPDFLPNGKNKTKGILFLDEINLAPFSVMAAAYQLILDRKLGEYKLPDGWIVIAAGNRIEDNANVTKFPAPLANRFIHHEVEHNIDDWISWAIANSIHPQIISFLGKMPQHLIRMPKSGEKSFPTPRSWANASILHTLGYRIDSSVGDGVAAEFYAFLKVYDKLPDLLSILTGKKQPSIDTKQLDILWALSIGLVTMAEAEHVDNLLKYIGDKFPKEFEVLTILNLAKKPGKYGKEKISMEAFLSNSPKWTEWIKKNRELISEGSK